MTTKRNHKKSVQKPRRLPPIVVVPDKTYIDDTGNVIPTDVILISDATIYRNMEILLVAWKEEFAKKIADEINGQRGIIKG